MKNIFLACTLLFSFSGFAQWTELAHPVPGYHFDYDLSVVTSETAFVLSGWSAKDTFTLNRTMDGGTTWESKVLPLWSDTLAGLLTIQFVSSETGYIYGNDQSPYTVFNGGWMFKTVDAGTTWSRISLPDSLRHIQTVHFFSADRGVLLAYMLKQQYLFKIVVFTTQDGGHTWEVRQVLGNGFNAYQFRPDGSGVGFVISNSASLPYPTVFTTADFGASWQLIDTSDVAQNWAQYRQHIWYKHKYFINDTVGYSYYLENTTPYGPKIHHLTKTTDGGSTWNDEGLIWIEQLFQGSMESVDGSVWIYTGEFLFRNSGLSGSVEAVNPERRLAIAPNPVPGTSFCQLTLDGPYSGPVDVHVYHANGVLAGQSTIDVFEGAGLLELQNLPPGVYFVRARPESQSGGRPATGKVVVH